MEKLSDSQHLSLAKYALDLYICECLIAEAGVSVHLCDDSNQGSFFIVNSVAARGINVLMLSDSRQAIYEVILSLIKNQCDTNVRLSNSHS